MHNDDTTEEPSDNRESEEAGVGRRPVLKTAGAVGGASLLSGLASQEASAAATTLTVNSFELAYKEIDLDPGEKRTVTFNGIDGFADDVFGVNAVPMNSDEIVYQEAGDVSDNVSVKVGENADLEITFTCENKTSNGFSMRLTVLYAPS